MGIIVCFLRTIYGRDLDRPSRRRLIRVTFVSWGFVTFVVVFMSPYRLYQYFKKVIINI